MFGAAGEDEYPAPAAPDRTGSIEAAKLCDFKYALSPKARPHSILARACALGNSALLMGRPLASK